jgi:hypothetical protein
MTINFKKTKKIKKKKKNINNFLNKEKNIINNNFQTNIVIFGQQV